MRPLLNKECLDLAFSYAGMMSGCNKVAVGSVIVKDNVIIGLGANKAMPDLCKSLRGCLRVEKYGEDSKVHRNPEDCRAIHSEIDAICMVAKAGSSTEGAAIYVTRYPCESCAKAIVASGIKKVIYGGTADISDETRRILDEGYVDCYKVDGWREDNSDR